MADTLVETNIYNRLDDEIGLWGPYWIDESTAVIIFIDGDADLSFARTTDRGENWSTIKIDDFGTAGPIVVWFDQETPGDSGTLLHIAWFDQNYTGNDGAIFYQTVDISDGGLGTKRTVDTPLSAVGEPITKRRVALTKTVNGNLLLAYSYEDDEDGQRKCKRSVTDGVSWTDRINVYENGAAREDWLLLFPADVDAGDACGIFWDRSANELSIKMYDDSANTWTETSISGSMVDDIFHMNMDGSVRQSDKHILVAAHSDADSAGDDLKTWDLTVDSIASPTVTAKTNIFTDQNEAAQVSVFINQQNDDVYIAYFKGGTWELTVDVVYHKSTDGMATWGGEQAYSESAADDFRLVHAGRTVGDAGGRYQPSFYDDDEVDIYVNETNDVEIAAAAAALDFGWFFQSLDSVHPLPLIREGGITGSLGPIEPEPFPVGPVLHVENVTDVIRFPGRMVGY